MLKINIDEDKNVFTTFEGTKKQCFVEMMVAVHGFYQNLDREDAEKFKNMFKRNENIIFATNEELEERFGPQGGVLEMDDEPDRVDSIVSALRELADILGERDER